MNSVDVYVKLEEGAHIPTYITDGAVGADLYAFLDKEVILRPGEISKIPTGVYLQLPPGYEAQIRPRSGLAAKYGITLLNSPGTIDWDYRGEIHVILINLGKQPFIIKNGMRIAQMVIAPVVRANFSVVKQLDNTQRGEGGFGHSGTF